MTSSEEANVKDEYGGSTSGHRSRVRRGGMNAQNSTRACDECRRKKRRCAGAEPGSERCYHCSSANSTCTWLRSPRKRGPKSYVESLEERLQELELIFQKLNAEVDENGDAVVRKNSPDAPSSSERVTVKREPDLEDSPHPSDDEMDPAAHSREHVDWIQRVQNIPTHPRYYGKSASLMLIKTAVDYIHERDRRLPPSDGDLGNPYKLDRRPEMWKLLWWELATQEEVVDLTHKPTLVEGKPLRFPDSDLIPVLVDLYFANTNVYYPTLHRPTFEKSLAEGLHLRNLGFAHVLLLVCATGGRVCDDPRVLVDGKTKLSAGWKWFVQGQIEPSAMPMCEDVYELQRCCLSAIYVQGTSAPYTCWEMIGVGIRLAMDMGIHRRKMYGSTRSVDEELCKRAFWILVNYDRLASCNLGRPCAIQDEDFDLDLPACCDDEYWITSDPAAAFQQPPNEPSIMAYYLCFTQLNRILAFALRTLYSINNSKALLGLVGANWQQRIVDQIASAMQGWMNSLPKHLRWDPRSKHPVFFHQSAILHAMFYHIKIIVHRPFIASLRTPSPVTGDSLSICVEAARACSTILDLHIKGSWMLPLQCGIMAFTAGLILLLPVWRKARSREYPAEMDVAEDIFKCMRTLGALEVRWHSPGRMRDMLCELATFAGLPPSPPPSPLPASSPLPPQEPSANVNLPELSSDHLSADVPPPASTDARSGASQYRPSGSGSFMFHDDLQAPTAIRPPAMLSERNSLPAPFAFPDPSPPNASIGSLGDTDFLDSLLSLWEPNGPFDQMGGTALTQAWFPMADSPGRVGGSDRSNSSGPGLMDQDDFDLTAYLRNGPAGPRP